MISRESIDKIIETAKIHDVISDYISLRKRGSNYIGLCPFHGEKTPSFSVNPARNIFKCFGCGKAGNAVHFLMEHDQLSYPEALRLLAQKYHIELVEDKVTEKDLQVQSDRDSLFIITQRAFTYFTDILHKNKEGQAIGLSYLRERGIRDDIINLFGLGYSLNEKDRLYQTLKKEKFNTELLVKAGFVSEYNSMYYDKFRDRIMFPIHTISGKIAGFGGRIINQTTKETAKYLNSSESEIFDKSKLLYGLFLSKKSIVKHDKCYLTEGYFDVISLFQAGIENVVASCGTAFTVEQLKLIRRFTKNITILYDGDDAGIKAAQRAFAICMEEEVNVRAVILPQGHDPDTFCKANSAEKVKYFLDNNELHYVAFYYKYIAKDIHKDPLKKTEAVHEILSFIAPINDVILRTFYVKECSMLFDVDEQSLTHELIKLRKKKLGKTNKEDVVISEKPIQKPISSLQTNRNKGIEVLERELLKILLEYADEPITKIEYDNYIDIISVKDFIIWNIREKSLFFQTPIAEKIFTQYVLMTEAGQTPDLNYFTQNPDQEIARFSISLFENSYEDLSRIWQTSAETSFEETLYLQTCKTIFKYEIERLLCEKDAIKELLKNEKDAETINSLLTQRMNIEKKIKDLHEDYGNPGVLF
ncbi:MAG: DNA primase [Bacteroidales bacterium]